MLMGSKGLCEPMASLDHDFAGHLGMNRAKVRVGAGFAEGIRKLLVDIQDLGLEDFVVTDDCVGNVVAVGPRDRSAGRYRYSCGTKTEVVDLHLHRRWLGLSRSGALHFGLACT